MTTIRFVLHFVCWFIIAVVQVAFGGSFVTENGNERIIGNAIAHPIQTGKAVIEDIKEKTQTSAGQGELAFDAVTSLLTAAKAGKIAKAADKASDAVKAADNVTEATNAIKMAETVVDDAGKATTATKGFDSFGKLKESLGSPGEGKQWHHIVEQCQIKKSDFLPTDIHNELNVVAVDTATHIKISAYYNGIDKTLSENLRVRDWLAGKSFEFQKEFGIHILKQFRVIK